MTNSQQWMAGPKDTHIGNVDRCRQLALHRASNNEIQQYMRGSISPSGLTREGLSKLKPIQSDRWKICSLHVALIFSYYE